MIRIASNAIFLSDGQQSFDMWRMLDTSLFLDVALVQTFQNFRYSDASAKKDSNDYNDSMDINRLLMHLWL